VYNLVQEFAAAESKINSTLGARLAVARALRHGAVDRPRFSPRPRPQRQWLPTPVASVSPDPHALRTTARAAADTATPAQQAPLIERTAYAQGTAASGQTHRQADDRGRVT
jgi:hypothetical protein